MSKRTFGINEHNGLIVSAHSSSGLNFGASTGIDKNLDLKSKTDVFYLDNSSQPIHGSLNIYGEIAENVPLIYKIARTNYGFDITGILDQHAKVARLEGKLVEKFHPMVPPLYFAKRQLRECSKRQSGYVYLFNDMGRIIPRPYQDLPIEYSQRLKRSGLEIVMVNLEEIWKNISLTEGKHGSIDKALLEANFS